MAAKKKYLLTGDETKIPIDWTLLPEDVIDKIPGKYFCNTYSMATSGEVIEKTVVHVVPVSRVPKDCSTSYDLDDIMIYQEKEPDEDDESVGFDEDDNFWDE